MQLIDNQVDAAAAPCGVRAVFANADGRLIPASSRAADGPAESEPRSP
jgi:hypothetical protein